MTWSEWRSYQQDDAECHETTDGEYTVIVGGIPDDYYYFLENGEAMIDYYDRNNATDAVRYMLDTGNVVYDDLGDKWRWSPEYGLQLYSCAHDHWYVEGLRDLYLPWRTE